MTFYSEAPIIHIHLSSMDVDEEAVALSEFFFTSIEFLFKYFDVSCNPSKDSIVIVQAISMNRVLSFVCVLPFN